MVEAANTSETPVNCYQTTRRDNHEDSHLHICRRENLKSDPPTRNFSLINCMKQSPSSEA
jgi:hypothetical protein